MSGHDADMTELDRRGRSAAAALRAGIDTLVAPDPDASHERAAGPAASGLSAVPGPGATAPPEPIRLDRPRRSGGRRATRPWLLAAAAFAGLATVAGAIAVVTGDDGRPDVTSGGQGGALLPGWLPEGLEPRYAIDLAGASAPRGLAGEVVVYGDADADDPWASTLGVIHVASDEDGWGSSSPDGEPVTVAGHPAMLSEVEGPTGLATSGQGWQVDWPVDDGHLIVGGLGRDEVLAAAEAATTEPAIGSAGLPAGYTELARGPLGAASPTLFADAESGLSVTYTVPAEGDDDMETTLAVVQRPAPESAVDLLRGGLVSSDAITVRGRHAVVARGEGVVAVQWAEPEGQLVTVVGSGLTETEDVVLQVAERLRPAGAAEVAALLSEHAPPVPGEFAEPPEGHVVVDEGETATGRWRVVADATAPEGMEALSIERMSESASSSGTSSGTSPGGPSGPPPLELTTDTEDGSTIVYGLAHEDTTELGVEGLGHGGAGGISRVEGWSRRVIVVDVGELPRGGAIDAVVIARAADGRELGRYPIHLEPDPVVPEGDAPTGADIEEECTTFADGTTECSTSGSTGASDTIPGD